MSSWAVSWNDNTLKQRCSGLLRVLGSDGTCPLGIAAFDCPVLMEAGGTLCRGPSEMGTPFKKLSAWPRRYTSAALLLPSYLVSPYLGIHHLRQR